MALNLERDGEEGIVDCQSPCVSVREETVAGSVGTEQLAKETVVGGRERWRGVKDVTQAQVYGRGREQGERVDGNVQ